METRDGVSRFSVIKIKLPSRFDASLLFIENREGIDLVAHNCRG